MSKPHVNCRECVEFLDRYVDGELSDTERDVFEVHLEKCKPCRDFLHSYRESVKLARECLCCKEKGAISAAVPERLVRAILEARCAGKKDAPASTRTTPDDDVSTGCGCDD